MLAVLLAVAAWRFFQPDTAPATTPASDTPRTITLTIDFGDGQSTTLRSFGQTALEVLQSAAQEDPRLELEIVGQDSGALVTAIGDHENEGIGRNWLFEVNGVAADRSAAITPVSEGDSVLWRFARQE